MDVGKMLLRFAAGIWLSELKLNAHGKACVGAAGEWSAAAALAF